MEKAKILIVEDEPIIAADLAFTLAGLGYETYEPLSTGEEALAFLRKEQPSLILLDIQLEGDLDGIDTAHQINAIQPVPIIFLSSNTDQSTFSRARLTQPYAFLSKPFRAPDLRNAIELALSQAEERQPKEEGGSAVLQGDRIFVKSKDRMVKIMLEDILWVEAERYYSWIVTADKRHLVTISLKKLEEQLPRTAFVRASRSHLVNTAKVDGMDDYHLFIGKETILIGKSYKEGLLKRFLRF